jgi:hypothetical protein
MMVLLSSAGPAVGCPVHRREGGGRVVRVVAAEVEGGVVGRIVKRHGFGRGESFQVVDRML